MSQSNYKIKTLTIESGNRIIDVSRGFVSMDYYEDVTSPSIVLDVNIIDGDGTIANLPILGGEYFNIEIESTYFRSEEIIFTKENDNPLCIVNASFIPKGNSRLYTLRLMSYDALSNETTRVVRRYDAPISQIIKSILEDDEELIRTSKTCNIEPTSNSYSFIGCSKRPFDVISWLCPKSIPSTRSTSSDSSTSAGFLFFETRKGYNFVSIDKKFKDFTNPVELFQSQSPIPKEDPLYYQSFSNITITENNDVLKSLRMGTYAHNSIILNMSNMQYDVITTKLTDKYKQGLIPSNEDSSSFKLNGLEEYPSRLMYKILDPGVMERDEGPVPLEQLPKYQTSSYMRYNLLFSSVANITLPLNVSLCAGDVVKCKISKSQRIPTLNKYDENLEEQRYIISKIRHTFDQTNNFSSLELISDSYSVTST